MGPAAATGQLRNNGVGCNGAAHLQDILCRPGLPPVHQQVIAQSGLGSEDKPNRFLSASTPPQPTAVPGPSLVADHIKAWQQCWC